MRGNLDQKSEAPQLEISGEADEPGDLCRACREPIHRQASLCPHCGSRQRPDRWRVIGRALAIVGAIAALLGLTKGLLDLEELLSERRAVAAIQ